MNIPEEAVEAARSALCNEGLTEDGGSPHAWRCEYPDLYPGYCTCIDDLARAALEAAWAVMHPEVTTAEELDALPSGSIIMNASEQQVLRNYVGEDDPATWELMGALYQDDPVWSAQIIEFGPFTVIYRP